MQITLGKRGISCKIDEPLVVHSKNVVKADVAIEDDSWRELVKTIIWRNGDITIEQKLDADKVTIPWEVLSLTGHLLVGICGTGNGGEVVRPTTWATVGTVVQGVLDGAQAFETTEVTPTVYDTLLSDLADVKDAMTKNAEKYSGTVIVYQAGEGIRITDGHVISAEVTIGELDTKASAQHTHVISDVAELNERLDAKADKAHVHAIDDVDGLEARMQALEQAGGGNAGGGVGETISKTWQDPFDGSTGEVTVMRSGNVATLYLEQTPTGSNVISVFKAFGELKAIVNMHYPLSTILLSGNGTSMIAFYDGETFALIGSNVMQGSVYIGQMTWVCE